MMETPNVPAGWLEVHEGKDGSPAIECPRRGTLPRRECFGCEDCGGPAIDRSGRHVYVVCDYAQGEDARPTQANHGAPRGVQAGSESSCSAR